MKFDTEQEGLYTIFMPYQAIMLEYIWKLNEKNREGIRSAQAHKYLNGHPEMRSRASVINSLDAMIDEGVLVFEKEICKGGHRRVYYPAMDRDEFAVHVCNVITAKLREVFPSVK